MMHLRVVVPARLTDEVTRRLHDDPAATNIIVIPGAAKEPEGDVLFFDVAREGTSDVIEALREQGVEHSGSIALSEVDVSISDAATEAEHAAPGLGDDSVIWEEVEKHTGDETQLSVTYLVIMSIAMMIAAVGILQGQLILIVGAMVVGPDFGPLAALSVALVRRRGRIAWHSLLAVCVGFGVGMAVTALFTLFLTWLGFVDVSMLTHDHPDLDFIWRPGGLGWAIGFLAGVAGLISLTSARSGVLVGVAISVTTIPAAANAAVAAAYAVPAEALGALQLLGINLVSIVVGGTVTLLFQRLWRHYRHVNEAR